MLQCRMQAHSSFIINIISHGHIKIFLKGDAFRQKQKFSVCVCVCVGGLGGGQASSKHDTRGKENTLSCTNYLESDIQEGRKILTSPELKKVRFILIS